MPFFRVCTMGGGRVIRGEWFAAADGDDVAVLPLLLLLPIFDVELSAYFCMDKDFSSDLSDVFSSCYRVHDEKKAHLHVTLDRLLLKIIYICAKKNVLVICLLKML